MSRFVTGLMTCMIAMALTMGATLTAASARMTRTEKVALKQAVVACKAEAKGKKIKWLARWKYVNQCVVAALKDHPGMDIQRMLKEHPRMRDLPAEQWDAF
ncbi:MULTISPECIES: hypothetical protein [Bradyrhizobium]|jgi:hypothetical protein|uniref:Uncharacterized protein n=2 Tax=Bradyrhizobium TaxID=374 RepID=A0ABY0PHM0_9BRAD|nr:MULTISPECIES: hypothetical protein [Bradyrhizobium]SDI01938.1 hypothetical protein SAMN05444163_1663 [Bradyrhizobium ottawaense]SED87985.1 hypothetical protein SAMN05444171_5508 [Bradyrhizobium lablabi]SHL84328.1 hypothetical protein SAMN05444321_4299 [Bradyrhizobium lablabi]